MPQSFGSARPPSLRGSNAKSGTTEARRQVPKEVSGILTNGQTQATKPPRVIDPKKHKDKLAQMYANMFLYIPWQDEEDFFGEASRSEEACQKLWEEWGDAAKYLKKQLYRRIKESWLS